MTPPFIPQKAMVIMAHPDDPEFFCGGLVAQWAKHGVDISYLILTNGNKGSADPTMTPEKLKDIRRTEQRAAAAVLGVKTVTFFNEDDGELTPTLRVRTDVVRELRRFRPDAVIAPDPTTYFWHGRINHPDHRAAGEIAVNALFPAVGNRMYHPEFLADGLTPHTVAHIFLAGTLQADFYVDISDVFDQKVQAILSHASQIPQPEALSDRLREWHHAVDEYGREVLRESYRRLHIG